MLTSSPKRINVLALDGGGVRGLSSLLILKDLMVRLHEFRKAAGTASPTSDLPRPCDVFDLIIGTGTGGISALLLGRLHLSVQEAIDEYIDMASTVFTRPSFLRRFGVLPVSFDERTLEAHLRKVAGKYLHDPDAPIFDPAASPRCRVAVLAATSAHTDAPPNIFCTYSASPSFTLVDVARATCATAGLFRAVSLGQPPIKFLDAGSFGFNNPTEIGITESRNIWPARDVDVVVSLGTGSQKIVNAGRLRTLHGSAGVFSRDAMGFTIVFWRLPAFHISVSALTKVWKASTNGTRLVMWRGSPVDISGSRGKITILIPVCGP